MFIPLCAAWLQVLADNGSDLKKDCAGWQSQAQDALSKLNQLQELLAESASWEATQAKLQSTSGDVTAPSAETTADGVEQSDVASLRAALLQQQSLNASLDLQLRVVSAQLVRACGAYRSVGRLLLPMFGGLESKLVALKSETAAARS